MTHQQAFQAYLHADETIRGCESLRELDDASDFDEAMDNCPDKFTDAQKRFAHNIILHAYERQIGRA